MRLKFLMRLRRLAARALGRMAQKMSPESADARSSGIRQPYATEGWDHIPQGHYDYVPKGTYVFGPADRFLLVPKNRYRAVLLPDQSRRSDLGIGWLTEDNTAEGYDLLWGDEASLGQFRAEGDHAREKLKIEIVDHIDAFVAFDANVVDIGCGIGDLLMELRTRKSGVRVSGLDFSAKAVEGASASLPDGRFVQFVIDRTLPYEDNFFDVVLCTDVMEHLEHPKAVASELVRICRPGGLVAIVVPDGDVDQFMGHNWFWNQESLTALLADWEAKVSRLPLTREFIACIFPKSERKEI
ncbi:UNVERIFIED_ORG: ubiquinone/menaquinone biosynthesis C-methylase UbiE [Rhizobium esperanzae]